MVTPKVEREAEARNYGKFVISPLERGYGHTLGNALRRVLLSSLEGAAVTSIRIADVLHEFSEIPGVREDVIQVTLQGSSFTVTIDGTTKVATGTNNGSSKQHGLANAWNGGSLDIRFDNYSFSPP